MRVIIVADDGKVISTDGQEYISAIDLSNNLSKEEIKNIIDVADEIAEEEYQEILKKQEEESEVL